MLTALFISPNSTLNQGVDVCGRIRVYIVKYGAISLKSGKKHQCLVGKGGGSSVALHEEQSTSAFNTVWLIAVIESGMETGSLRPCVAASEVHIFHFVHVLRNFV